MTIQEKIRAIVVDDQDPARRERILVRLPGDGDNAREVWAEPCLLYNPCGLGGFSPPPPGAEVWVEPDPEDPDKLAWLGICL